MAHSYKIFPAIGVARVGNSEENYIAPESEGGLPIPRDGGEFSADDFRDAQGAMRRQAARFQVYRCDEDGAEQKPVIPGEGGVKHIEWTVHLANKKAVWYEFITNLGEDGYASNHPLRNADISDARERQQMIVDAGPRSLDGVNQHAAFSRDSNSNGYPMTFPPEDIEPHKIDTLGDMYTDAEGRCLVAGGHGHSGSKYRPVGITAYANNDGWWDDTSDGPVSAVLVMENGDRIDVTPAWVLVGPPAYAPQILNLVTLYDTIYDVVVRKMGRRPDIFQNDVWNSDYQPDWETEIKPILQRGENYPWVVAIPPVPHTFNYALLGNPDPQYNGLRDYYFNIMRAPNEENSLNSSENGYTMMPFLAGDDVVGNQQTSKYLKLTDTQYFMLQQWAAGKFKAGGDGAGEAAGDHLTRASLENCVGGAFSPGIEMTWISRNPLIYDEPFRVKPRADLPIPLSLSTDFAKGLEPGDVTKYMAIPWQADFNECSSQPIGDRIVWWWPAQRPSFVYTEAGRKKQRAWVGIDYDQNAPDFIQFADDLDMVKKWQDLGFIYNVGDVDDPDYIEVERRMPHREIKREEE